MNVTALLDQERYQEALDQGGVAAIRLMVDRFSTTKSNYTLREILIKAGPAAVAPLVEKVEQVQPQIRLEMVRVLSKINDPSAEEQAEKQGAFFKNALRVYWKGMALSWWDRENPKEACCDSCNSDIERDNAYYFVESRRMRCESCTTGKLKEWNFDWDYFGKSEIANALDYKPEPKKPREANIPPPMPKFTLYAFEVRAASSGAAGFGKTIVMEADQDGLKEVIRQRSNCMDSSVVIIPPNEWSPPVIASASVPVIQQAFPVVNSKVIKYLKRCGITNINESELIATGNVLPNPMSGRILFVYRLEGAPAKPQPAMKPSLASRTSGKGKQQNPTKKWWEFWKN